MGAAAEATSQDSWIEVAALWFTIVGFPLALLGLVLAWVGIVQTRNALRGVQQQLADNHLLILIPQLAHAKDRLGLAVHDKNARATLAALEEWRGLAIQVKALAAKRRRDNGDLTRNVRDAMTHITISTQEILSGRAAASSTRVSREHMGHVTDAAMEILAEMKAFVDEDPEPGWLKRFFTTANEAPK